MSDESIKNRLARLKRSSDRSAALQQLTKLAGIFEPPPEMVRSIFEWARSKYCSKLLFEVDKKLAAVKRQSKAHDQTVVELLLLKRECQKYTSQSDSSVKFTITLPFNFDNWKYAKSPEQWAVYEQARQTGDLELTVWLNITTHKWPEFTGFWNARKAKITLNTQLLFDVENFQIVLAELYQTIYHELQHLGQSWFELEEDIPGGYLNEPPKSQKAQKKRRTGPSYFLEGREFYPTLKSYIEALKAMLARIPVKYRMEMLKRFVNPKYKPNLGGMSPKDKKRLLNDYTFPPELFAALQKYDNRKYRKAVVELFKELQNSGLLDSTAAYSPVVKTAGIFEPPPKSVAQVFHWAREKVAAKVLHNTEISIKRYKDTQTYLPDDRQIVELTLLKKECLKYTNEPAANETYKRTFPFDLTGWKYKDKPNRYKLDVQLIFKHDLPKAGDWGIDFTVRLFVDDELYTVQGFKNTLGYLHEAVYHELQHAGQTYLSIQPTEKDWSAGYPSKSIQTKPKEVENLPREKTDPEDIHYPLRNLEFYPLLRNEINELERRLVNMPKRMRMEIVKSFVDSNYISDILTDTTNTLTDAQANMVFRYFEPSRFFKKLRIYEPLKYRKAVAELWKIIQREVGDIR